MKMNDAIISPEQARIAARGLGAGTVRLKVVGARDNRLASDAGAVVRIASLRDCCDGLDRGNAARWFR